jgi:ABC-type sulfate transport system permease subunit
VGAIDHLRRVPGRVRERPWIAVAIALGAILVCAWLAWAVYVSGEHGARQGVGVLVAWPALVLAAAIVALPFVGGYFLIQRLRPSDEAPTAQEGAGSDAEPDESKPEPAAN